MLKVDIISLVPKVFDGFVEALPLKKAISKGLIEYKVTNLRDYALDSYGTVDDKPYGGGVGMVLMVEPIFRALCDILGFAPENFTSLNDNSFLEALSTKHPNTKIILLDPKGTVYNQKFARSLATTEHLVFVCGRYEGLDERIGKYLCTDRVSLGNYVLSGGELGALVITESIVRLLPGVLEKPEASSEESFTKSEQDYEHPQYTRPENFRGLEVPETLLSGDHGKIAKWKQTNKSRN